MDSSFGSGRSSPVGNLSRSSSLRNSCSSRTSLIRRNQSMSAKHIRFYRNGDRYFAGLKLAVSPERYKEFDSLLVELSEKLDLSSGAVRFIFNAEDGSLITDISQLQYGVSYVCSSSNILRQVDDGYGKHLHSNWAASQRARSNSSTSKNINLSGGLLNVDSSFGSSRGESSRDYIKPKLVTVIRNGKPPQKKVTLLLNSKTALSYEKVLDQLSARGSLGKVDKLYSVDGRQIKELRDLFDDDTVFIALSANEKFPDDGIELDPNSYRITPYRELKRPVSNSVKRSNSLRSSMRSKPKDEAENVHANKAKGQRPKSMGPNSKVSGSIKAPRPKGVNVKKQCSDQNKDELYPTQVFEASSDSASRSVGRPRKTEQNVNPMDIYNTVWLSDYDSCKSGMSSVNHSQTSLEHSSFTDSLTHPHDHDKTSFSVFEESHNSIDQQKEDLHSNKKMYRTQSLPGVHLSLLSGEDLRERFAQLQLEQENKQLLKLTSELKSALAKLEKEYAEHIERPESEQAYLSNIFAPAKCSADGLPLTSTPSPEKSEGEFQEYLESRLTKHCYRANGNHGCCLTQ